MKRIGFTLAVMSTLAFAGAPELSAHGTFSDQSDVIEVAAKFGGGIDPIITGPALPMKQLGILPHLDACDADCQAERLGIVFDE